MSHHYRREQRRARVIAAVAAIVLLAIAIPLFAMPRLRLDIAETLGMVPNHAREQLFSGAAGLELVVLVEEVPVEFTLPIEKFTAVYVAERTSDGVVLHDLAVDRTISVPLQRYDRISAADRSAILLVDEQSRPAQAVLVMIASGEVRELPPGETDPGIPGDWTADIFEGAAGCNAVSPDGNWVACATGAPRVFGDWDLYVHPAGQSRDKTYLMNGLGTVPILGWAADSSALYLQNEEGVIKVPLDLDSDD